jgi:hypothetical protein
MEPAAAYVWLGLRDVEVAPSPKLHDQDVGEPVDVSVNATAWPARGEAGLKVKEAASVGDVTTVTICVTLLDDEALLAVKVTE